MGREREEDPPVEEEEVEEVEAVDPKAEIEGSCKPRCVKHLISYEACVKRIESDEQGQKHCTGQYFDYWGCIDQCAAPKVFRSAKECRSNSMLMSLGSFRKAYTECDTFLSRYG